MDLIKTAPDERCIDFIFDPKGGNGKSMLVNLLTEDPNSNCLRAPQLATIDRWTSAFVSQIQDYQLKNKKDPSTIFIDLPRKQDVVLLDSLYPILESLKNGYLETTFYGRHNKVPLKPPHIIVFTNTVPNMCALSKDRFRLHYITDKLYESILVRCDAYVEITAFVKKLNLVEWKHYAIVRGFESQKEFYEKKLSAPVYNFLTETLLKVDASFYTTRFSGDAHISSLLKAPDYVQKCIIREPNKNLDSS
jgi:hypothetical protein